jgi:hypothetical protein
MSSVDRIQIKLNGRRFEFAKDLALENLLFFKEYLALKSEQEQKDLQKALDFTYEKSEQKLVGAPGTAPVISHLDVFSFTGGKDGIPTATPDYFGLLQVALRKNKMPAFEWDELNRKEQEAVSWSVNLFKIEKFLKCFGTVTAKESAYEEAVKSEETTKPQEEEVRDKMADALAKAHLKIAEAQDKIKEQQQEKAQKQKQQQESNDDDDDENVVLTRMGCHFCGVATHDLKDCPFNQQKN